MKRKIGLAIIILVLGIATAVAIGLTKKKRRRLKNLRFSAMHCMLYSRIMSNRSRRRN